VIKIGTGPVAGFGCALAQNADLRERGGTVS
jgi:hypothetical protein